MISRRAFLQMSACGLASLALARLLADRVQAEKEPAPMACPRPLVTMPFFVAGQPSEVYRIFIPVANK